MRVSTWAVAALLVAGASVARAQFIPNPGPADPYAPEPQPQPVAPVAPSSPYGVPPGYGAPPPEVATPAPLYPQDAPTVVVPAETHRRRFTVGAGAGLSSIKFRGDRVDESSQGGLGVNFMAGLYVNQRIAIIGAADFIAFDDAGEQPMRQTVVTVAAQLYVRRSVWVRAGLGIASLGTMDNADERTDIEGSALTLAIGGELISKRRYAVTGELHYVGAHYDDFGSEFESGSMGLAVGLQWF